MSLTRLTSWSIRLAFLIFIVLFAGWPESAQAGCTINLSIKNTGDHLLQVYPHSSRVRNKGGFWRSLQKGFWFRTYSKVKLKSGQLRGDGYLANYKCAKPRRYHIYYSCLEGPKKGAELATYYPSADGFTTKQTLTIALRHCG